MNAPRSAAGAATAGATLGATASPAPARTRRVVDAPTRMAHWLFAATFTGAWLSGDSESWRALHVTLGYTMAGVLAFRVLYGLFGPPQARLSLLWRRVAALPAWGRDLLAGWSLSGPRTQWSLSGPRLQKSAALALGLSMAALLALAAPLALSGYATFEEWGGDWLEEVHEFFANAALALVLLHLGAIAALSALRRRNAARPMLSGTAEGPGPDLAKSDRRPLAVALLAAALAFGAWQWQQPPSASAPDDSRVEAMRVPKRTIDSPGETKHEKKAKKKDGTRRQS
ncbi:cytochrome b/b6 domain-containing protein [Aquabacterium humicola]|uniref:cytochrome b/b6 domain-containing protein n=1 Tax=Aquabacterium humicola TaxID=3237377 RepID=UPI0025439B93|nr:cytochrome b/b6 domain-containing protein [Rubrivivax pictus]